MSKRRDIIKLLVKALALSSGCILFVCLFNYIADPLQFYRKATLYKPTFYAQQRYQNPGFAKNYDYNTVVVGTSMAENFSNKQIKEKLGLNSIRLTISGSSAREQYLILNTAMKTGKVQNVIWEVDYYSMGGSVYGVRDQDAKFPFYLYDSNFFNDYKYLLDSNTTRLSINGIINSLSGKVKDIDDQLDTYCRWGVWESPSDFGKDKVYANFMERLKNGEFQKSAYIYRLYSWDVIKGNLDTNVIPFINNNKNVKFYLYFPPYSILGQKAFYLQDVLKTELEYKKYLVEKVGKCKNVKIYDFQNAKDIIYNLDNYKDKSHHRMEVNDYIIDCMAEEKYNVKGMDLDKEYDKFTKDVAAYDIYKNQ